MTQEQNPLPTQRDREAAAALILDILGSGYAESSTNITEVAKYFCRHRVESTRELVENGTALVRQLRASIHYLNGQAYSSTLSALNVFDAALTAAQHRGERV